MPATTQLPTEALPFRIYNSLAAGHRIV